MNILAWILAVIGAINWGLVGFFQFDLVAAIFGGNGTVAIGQAAVISRIIYALVGLAGLWSIMLFHRIRGRDRDRDRDK